MAGRAYRRGFQSSVLILGMAIMLPAVADSPDEVSVTPYRPTVSTPAQLSAPGWLETEFGGLATSGPGPQRQDTTPYALKLAFSPDWGLRLSGNGYTDQTDASSQTERGISDTTVTLKRRFAIDDAAAFGLEASVLASTAKTGLGNGRTGYGANGIYSVDMGAYHLDVNVLPSWLGARGSGTSPWQLGAALALSHPVTEQWGLSGELSGFSQTGVAHTAQVLGAGTYNLSKRVVLDLGGIAGLNHESPHWGVFTGITFLTAKLF